MTINILSGLALVLFSIILINKTKHLKKAHKRANHLIVGKKPALTRWIELFVVLTTFPMMTLWGLSTIGFSFGSVWHDLLAIQIVGIVFMYAGVVFYGVAVFQLGEKWQLGVDYDENDYFVQKGLYQISRHPAYLGIFMIFAGILTTYGNFLIAGFAAGSYVSLFLIAKEEEKFLMFKFNESYATYKTKVSMFLGTKRCNSMLMGETSER